MQGNRYTLCTIEGGPEPGTSPRHVVADQGWIGAYVNILNPVLKVELKHFKRPELGLARTWLAQAAWLAPHGRVTRGRLGVMLLRPSRSYSVARLGVCGQAQVGEAIRR